jgi:hypothetical protein
VLGAPSVQKNLYKELAGLTEINGGGPSTKRGRGGAYAEVSPLCLNPIGVSLVVCAFLPAGCGILNLLGSARWGGLHTSC